MIEALGSDDQVDPKDKQALQQYSQARVMTEAREVLENDVRHCRLKSTYKRDTANLHVLMISAQARTRASALSKFRGVFAVVLAMEYCVQSGEAQTTSKWPGSYRLL